jgi:hypothetical protein
VPDVVASEDDGNALRASRCQQTDHVDSRLIMAIFTRTLPLR